MKRLVSLLVVVAAMLVSTSAFANNHQAVTDISMKDLQAAIKSHHVVLLDCNGSDSFKQHHIPGAIDFDANKAKLKAMLPANKHALIVAYCAGPACGMYKEGAAAAIALGYTNVKHFKDGINGWMAAKQPIAH